MKAMKTFVEEHHTSNTPFDIIWESRTPEEAGASWWLEAMWESDVTMEDVGRRIEQGPPRNG